MKKSQVVLVVVGAALIFGATYYWRGEQVSAGRAAQSPTQSAVEPRSDVPPPSNAAATPANVGASEKKTVATILAGHARVVDGLNEALVTFGRDDPDLASAALQAAEACGDLVTEADLDDPRSGLMAGMRDDSKIWAIEKLQVLCDGFDGRKFLALLGDRSADNPMQALISGGKDAQLASAKKAVSASKDRMALAQAGPVLIERDELPIKEIFGSAAPMGKVELSANWIQATALGTCAAQLGCGPDSPITISYCARMGCRPGVSYQEALSETLAPRDYRAVVAFSNWMRARGI